jgi:hypothetical protein
MWLLDPPAVEWGTDSDELGRRLWVSLPLELFAQVGVRALAVEDSALDVSFTREGRAGPVPGIHEVLFRADRSLGEAGQAPPPARPHYFRRQYGLSTRQPGPDRPGTLAIRSNLVSWVEDAGTRPGSSMPVRCVQQADWPCAGMSSGRMQGT